MKKIILIPVALIMITAVMAFAPSMRPAFMLTPITELEPKPIKPLVIDSPLLVKIEIKVKGHNEFLDALGHRESGNRYDIVNRYGYMGKYQFGKSTLKTLKIKVSPEAFLSSPKLQEYAMQQLLIRNKRSLRKYIEKYNGQIVHGVLVTESGLLAAAHLGGAGSVKKWFRNGTVRKDGNGVKITSYMVQFSKYRLNIN